MTAGFAKRNAHWGQVVQWAQGHPLILRGAETFLGSVFITGITFLTQKPTEKVLPMQQGWKPDQRVWGKPCWIPWGWDFFFVSLKIVSLESPAWFFISVSLESPPWLFSSASLENPPRLYSLAPCRRGSTGAAPLSETRCSSTFLHHQSHEATHGFSCHLAGICSWCHKETVLWWDHGKVTPACTVRRRSPSANKVSDNIHSQMVIPAARRGMKPWSATRSRLLQP